MSLIRHCIVDTTSNIVVNIINYSNLQTGVPLGLESNLLCVQSDAGQIGGTYANGVITNPVVVEDVTLHLPTPTINILEQV